MKRTPTIFVVDDDVRMRDSLSWLLASVGLPVKTFGSATDFLKACDPHCHGCLILDIRILRRMDSLTSREREVLDLVVGGSLNKQIAATPGHQQQDRRSPPRSRHGKNGRQIRGRTHRPVHPLRLA